MRFWNRVSGCDGLVSIALSLAKQLLLDEDLSAMYLTSRAQGRPRALHDHEQLELLLESFTKQVEEIVSEVDTTVVCCSEHRLCVV